MKTIDDVYVNFWGKPKQPVPAFTEMQLALMEGGHSLEEPIKMSFLKSLTNPVNDKLLGSVLPR